MKSQQISLTLVPSGNLSCSGCLELKRDTPILFNLMLEFFGLTNEEEEKEFLLKFHMNGHRIFNNADQPKQIES